VFVLSSACAGRTEKKGLEEERKKAVWACWVLGRRMAGINLVELFVYVFKSE
jgi:hypothetical protein